MKRIVCLILTALIVFSFAGCGKGKTSSDSDSVDLEYYLKLGKIPECKYSLGDSVDKINDELSKEYEDSSSEDMVYSVTEGEKTVLIDNGNYLYYYAKDKESNGVSYIVDYDTAFGFDIGTVSVEIKDTLSDYQFTEEDANENNAFFLFGITDATVLKYSVDNYVVVFVFQDNGLYATAIYDTDNWIK